MKKTDLDPGKTVIGMVEPILIRSKKDKEKRERVLARIDTGAAKSSIDSKLVYALKLGPVISVNKVRNAHGTTLRPVIETSIIIKRRKIKSLFTVADRSNLKYKMLIGRNVLSQGFLIDPMINEETYEEKK